MRKDIRRYSLGTRHSREVRTGDHIYGDLTAGDGASPGNSTEEAWGEASPGLEKGRERLKGKDGVTAMQRF